MTWPSSFNIPFPGCVKDPTKIDLFQNYHGLLNRIRNAPADAPSLATWTGFRNSRPGLCNRVESIFTDGNDGTISGMRGAYCLNDCNSNWYAASLFACAIGFRPVPPDTGTPLGPSGWGVGDCSSRVPFSCIYPSPGSHLTYGTATYEGP